MSETIEQKRNLLLALRRKEDLAKSMCFNPRDLLSRPTKIQQKVLNDINTMSERYVLGGNQCQPEGTLILTKYGLTEIQNIKIGDIVYDENGKEIEVEAVFKNGKQRVVELINRGIVWGESTLNHTWLTTNSSKGGEKELTVEEFKRDTQIRRLQVKAPLGNVRAQHAYTIGALLGDGCSRSAGLVISGTDIQIVEKIATELNTTFSKDSGNNYNWRFKGKNRPEYYSEWCKNRYAHEKTVDMNIIKSWDRQSLLNYVAGVLDTDGSIYVDSWDNLTISCEMQSLPIIESLKYAFLALWQVPTNIHVCDRDKYVNGPTYVIKVSCNEFTKYMLSELNEYLQVPRKKWKPEYAELTSSKTTGNRIGVKLGKIREAETYDIRVKSNRSLYLTATGLVTHNSGKSNLGGREAAWIFTNNHPTWKNKPTHPLLMIVVGKTHKIIREELWEGKIKPFLREGEYKIQKEGPALNSVTHENGNRIIFFSHKSPEECREAVQAFVADWVWLDEMPSSYKLLTELHTRCQANSAPFLATFTPLLRNQEIKNHIENGNPKLIKKYILKTYDNPTYSKEQLEDMKSRHSLMSDAQRATRTEGEWYSGDNAVYDFSTDTHCENPEEYHPSWRHIESVDPAASGKAGYTLLAENPNTGVWYLIKDKYIEGKAPSELLDTVQKLTSGVNCVKKVSDSHEAWFIKEAGLSKVWYDIPHKKTERKKELIKNLQEALHQGKLKIATWCQDTIDEFTTCQWAENADRIVNSRHYHLLDCLQYAVDVWPSKAESEPVLTIQQLMRKRHKERLVKEAAKQKNEHKIARIMPNRRSRWRR